MITAIVRYRLPTNIGRDACRAHFEHIAPSFGLIPGLIRKQFIWSETGIAGGIYQWERGDDAKLFYSGAWLDGILARYGTSPEIEYFETVAITDNPGGVVTLPAISPDIRKEQARA